MLEILGNIGFDWPVALANLVNFLIIFFLLHKFVFKPLGKTVEKRKRDIADGLAAADKNQQLLLDTKHACLLYTSDAADD